MSKEEFLKIQTCVLKVNIHCEGCKNKVKKILQRIEGVYTIKIDSESGKVTVSGNVDSASLIKKLMKKGKHAELWGSQKANNNQNQLSNQFKNLQIENGKGGNGNKGQGEKGTNNNNQIQIKGGNPGGMPLPQQLQHFQQMKGVPDMKMPPQFKDLKIPMNLGGNRKTVKFDLPDEDGFTDDEFDDDDDEYDEEEEDDDDDFDDEMDLMPAPNKMKPMMDNGGGAQMPNIMHLMNGKKGGIMPQMNMGGGGNKGCGNQIQGGGGSPKKSGKNGGGHPQDVGKNFGGTGGGQNKNSGGGPNFNANGGGMNNGLPSMPNMMAAMKGSVPNMGPMPTGQMQQQGGHHMGQGQMSNLPMGQIPAVQGLPAPAMSSLRSNGGGDYFQAAAARGPEILAGNPYDQHQHQMAAMMMNQQHAIANGNERFQPMMYAPQPPAVNYMTPPPYPYYPYPHPSDNYGSMFSDENPSACKVM